MDDTTETGADPLTAPHSALPLPKQIAAFEKVRRGSADWIFEQAGKELRHRRRRHYVGLIVQLVGYLCGFGAVIVLAILAWHFVDRGAPKEGAGIMVSAAVTLVGIFVTGKVVGRRGKKATNRPLDPKDGSGAG